jgi:uncharacterized membrane protein
MPSEPSIYSVQSVGGAGPQSSDSGEVPSQLVVITFDDVSQAEGLYEELVALDKKKVMSLDDAVFVSKNAEGKLEVDEKFHHEKRTGTVKGAALGTVVGLMVGGPLLGLAGGALVGRLVGKRMDLGIDEGTIKSVADDLENDHTALFVLGSTAHTASVIGAFSKFNGKIVQATIEPDAQAKLQKALDETSKSE